MTRKETLTVSFHTILPSEIWGWTGFSTVRNACEAFSLRFPRRFAPRNDTTGSSLSNANRPQQGLPAAGGLKKEGKMKKERKENASHLLSILYPGIIKKKTKKVLSLFEVDGSHAQDGQPVWFSLGFLGKNPKKNCRQVAGLPATPGLK